MPYKSPVRKKKMDIELLREELTLDEGVKEEIYLCSEGHPTFGIGHLIVRVTLSLVRLGDNCILSSC